MEKILSNIDSCTGCRSCEHVCPVSCIEIKPDSEGFLYPAINTEKCIKCGLCEKKCHMLHKFTGSENRVGYFGRSAELIDKSSSGGAFSAITEAYLDDGGKVFGAAFSEDYTYVKHICADKYNYQAMRKSKYVFCDCGDSFPEVKKLLDKNVKVVFSGTPCQAAALKTFLGREYDNLLTIDFICHGVPSISFYQDHIKAISKGEKITCVDFRSKAYGWREYCLKVETGTKTYLKPISEDFYLSKFMSSDVLRKCCYDCHYSNGNHQSDITVADYWKINKYFPDKSDNKGMSLIVANTDKGRAVTDSVSQRLNLTHLKPEEFSYVYKTHNYSAEKREQFMKSYLEKGYNSMKNDWWHQNRFTAWKKRVKRIYHKLKGK